MALKSEKSIEEILKNLNPEQKDAVTHGTGPLLIVAGAGTGKTTVIANRISYLIAAKMAKPEEILALTFTEKAASEMQERVDTLVPYGFADVWISTFHSFGNRVLEDESIFLGLAPNFKVMERPQQTVFLSDHFFELPLKVLRPLGNPLKHIENILTLFSRLKDEDVSSDEYDGYVKALEGSYLAGQSAEAGEEFRVQEELARVYRKYEELKMKCGVIDFSDQVWLVLKLFRDHPSVVGKYRKKFKYVLVDEFQDTNYSQFQLLKMLINDERNVTVVGDDDQSIYKFRGAAISNILGFKEKYTDAKQVVLTKNYRSNQKILDTAYELVKYNNPDRLEVKNNIDKKLVAMRRDKPLSGGVAAVSHCHFDTASQEADSVADRIKELVKGGKKFSDFAILVRSNSDADPFIKALNVNAIPWHFTGGSGLYARGEIRVMLSFLRLISDLSDSVAMFHLASSEIYNMPMADLIFCMTEASKKNKALCEVFERAPSAGVSSEGLEAIKKILGDLKKYMELSRELGTGQVLYKFINDTGWLKKLTDEKDPRSMEKVSNIAIFFNIIKNYSKISQEDRAQFFIRHLDMLIEAGSDPATAEADADEEAVNILTIHKAKGLEFPYVFMVMLIQNKFPSVSRRDPMEVPLPLIKDILPAGDFHKQEERRLFYVGMTRAKDVLYLSSSRDIGGKTERKVSQFVCEALNMPQSKIPAKKLHPAEAIKKNEELGESVRLPGIPVGRQLTLSHYQIDDYQTCPLKYKYVHIMRIPVLAHHSVIYGNAMHETIQFYYKKKMENEPVSSDDLLKKFESKWEASGFLSREHEEQRFEEGRQAIARFFNRAEKEAAVPAFIEKKFKFDFEGDAIIGRFDRVDTSPSGDVIIDFKTSDIFKQEEADDRAKKSTQLAVYALAWQTLTGKLPARVELHFVDSGIVGSVVPGEKMIEKIKDVIRASAEGIRNCNFGPNPQYLSCNYCPFLNICTGANKESSS